MVEQDIILSQITDQW